MKLYGTLGCHLCDIAKQEIVNSHNNPKIEYIDVAENNDLFEQFGEKIPVLEVSERFLYWPFSANQIDSVINTIRKGENNTRRYLR